jgi:hypothetical protein
MTDADADVDGDDQDDVDDEDLPEIDEEEFADAADLDALADEVEEEAGAADTNVDEDDQEDVDDAGDDLDSAASSESWGDMYVGTLTTVSNALIEEHGTQDAETIEEDLARQLHLDQHFDDWMETRGKSEMPPEQALLLGTTMFLVTVIGTKTELPSKLLEEADL